MNMDTFLKELTEHYGTSPSCPGVLVSCLGDGVHYAAVHIYNDRYGQERTVVCNMKSDVSLGDCVQKLYDEWSTNWRI